MKPILVRETLLDKGMNMFTLLDFKRVFPKSEDQIQYFLETQIRQGLFARLKKGFYALKTDLPGDEEIANFLYKPSYLSFEYALARYGIIPESPYNLTSATTNPTRVFTVADKAYSYYTIKQEAYTGYYLDVTNDLLSGSAALSPWALLIKPIVGIVIGGTTSLIGISLLLGQLLTFAAALALVYAMLKLFFKLIMAWLTIIFLTITAPFQFLFASLPGRQGMMTGWMLSMLGNILIFPAVIAVIFFAAFLVRSEDCPKDNAKKCLIQVSASNPHDNSSFIKPAYADGINIVGSDTFPLFGGINLNFMRILLAFGALMALPSIPDIITRTVGKAGQSGQMIGQEIMGNARFGQGYSQKSYQGGLAMGQQGWTGLTGETQIDASGNLRVVREGVFRSRGATGPALGPAAKSSWRRGP